MLEHNTTDHAHALLTAGHSTPVEVASAAEAVYGFCPRGLNQEPS